MFQQVANCPCPPQKWGEVLACEDGNPFAVDEWAEGITPGAMFDQLCDAFEREDEILEPEPEHGDFWGRVDEEKTI